MDKTKNASRNIVFGVLLKIYQVGMPFVLRSIMMYTIGVQYLGLNGLFSSVFHVLNLAELGVGSALVFSMYRPVAEDNRYMICALMRLYRLYYRIIGCVILALGCLLIPFLPNLIAGDVPADIDINVIYILHLGATVLSYWLFSYRNSVLRAHQRLDLVSKATIITDTIKYILQTVTLIITRNYYVYLIIVLLTQILNNIVIAIVSYKLFPQYKPEGKLDQDEVKTINKKIRDLFTSKLGGTIVNAADTIVISAFLGLVVLAKYQNYYFVLSSVIGFVGIVYSSIVAGVGNSMITKDREQNYTEFRIFCLLVTWICGYCISSFLAVYQDFIALWMGEKMLLDMRVVILLSLYFWVYEIVMMISVYKDAAGIWHEDRFRPLSSGLTNLAVNILLVQQIGIYGIVLSTILSVVFVSIPWIISNVFKLVFKRNKKEYIIKMIIYTIIIFAIAAVNYSITSFIPRMGMSSVVLKLVATLIISNTLLFLLFRHDEYFGPAKAFVFKMIKKATQNNPEE